MTKKMAQLPSFETCRQTADNPMAPPGRATQIFSSHGGLLTNGETL